MNRTLKYHINNIKYVIPSNYTLLQILSIHNIDIPRYCYHEKLSIAGNCRMCLVEEDKSLKPLASCAVTASVNGLKLYTNTEKVKKARESVIEFLLINHPLDCPICDQGGECDLQDQTSVFGSDRGRFYEYRRSVSDKNLGTFIKTSMNRCIHCTRCVRYAEEVAGFSELGIVGRGSKMEISNYVSAFISNELSGNVIDLCPVGALTSKPFSYSSRPWELSSFESIDVLDSTASNIRIDVRGNSLVRILPSINKGFNEDWISDKIRFVYDGLVNQRILNPFIKIGEKYISFSWNKVYYYLKHLFASRIGDSGNLLSFSFLPFVGAISDIESCYLLKFFSNWLGYSTHSIIPYMTGNTVNQRNDFRSSFILDEQMLNTSPNCNNVIVIVGVNLRLEAPLLSLRLKTVIKEQNSSLYSINANYNPNYFIRSLGNDFNTLLNIIMGKHWLCSNLLSSTAVYFVLSDSIYVNQCTIYLLMNYAYYIRKNLAFDLYINTFQKFISTIGALDLGFIPGNHSTVGCLGNNFKEDATFSFFYLVDIQLKDLFNFLKTSYPKTNFSKWFLVYQGSFGPDMKGFPQPNIFLPSKSFIEKASVYFNFEGKLKRTKGFSFSSSNYTRPDWQILTSLLRYFGVNFFNKKSSVFASIASVTPFLASRQVDLVDSLVFSEDLFCVGKFGNFNFSSLLAHNYFSLGIIERNSTNLKLAAQNLELGYLYNYNHDTVVQSN